MDELNVVCVGGGLGAPTIMRGLKAHTARLTGLIAVTDSGRSTGKVRIALDVPAPGDIRNALIVLAEGDTGLRRLFQHRFRTDKSEDLDGMAFGNLFLAALTQLEGSFLGAVEAASRLLGVRGRVLPVTLYNTHLCAVLADGSIVEGEVNVRAPGKPPIARVFLKDPHVDPCEGTIEAIRAADLITLGPGSLYTTVCACLLVPEIARAIADSDAPVVYVANTTRQPGQTDGMGLADHVSRVVEHLGGGGLDVALVNDDPPPAELLSHYSAQGLDYLGPAPEQLAAVRALGVEPVLAPLIDTSGPRELWNKLDTIRHRSDRVAEALVALVGERRARRAPTTAGLSP